MNGACAGREDKSVKGGMRDKCRIKGIEIAAVHLDDFMAGDKGGAFHGAADSARRACDEKPHLRS